jgi:alanyl aminopeptidase
MKTEHGNLAASMMFLAAALVAKAASASPPVPQLRLGNDAHPLAYSAELVVVPERSNFTGQITIELVLAQGTSFLWLHGHGLTVTNSHLEQQGRQIPAQPVIGGEEFLGFDFQQPASAGKAKLFVSYSGSMSDKDFSGLFRRQEDGQWYAATQMEATWARRVFPCFDEPAFKVPWRLALHVKKEHIALGNAPAVSEMAEPGGMKCVRFAQTRPVPSYLVAVAVGPFEAIDLGRVGRKNTPVRLFTPKGRTNEATFAARSIPELLRRLEEYYDIPYPYEKLDHVAVPQFPLGMENAGLILYGDTGLLSPPNRETVQFKRFGADFWTHAMAHQWFGDLVTMAWWDDIWLNEAFATWISAKIVDGWKPEWRYNLDQLQSTFQAAGADSLVTARCIRQPVKSPPDIDNAFDEITYDKGAAVLGMFESSIGEETFRKAIRSYLKRHAWKNASTADFLKSLDQAARQDIASAFSTFLDQPGIPLVSAESRGSSNGCSAVFLSQKRYLPVGSTGDTARRWSIPLNLRYETGGREMRLGMSLGKEQQVVSLKVEPTGLGWLLLNNQAAGYYVTAYRGELLSSLLQAGAQKLSAAERMSIAHSISKAVRSADIPLAEALSLQPKLLLDPERRVVEMTAGFMSQRAWVPQELKSNYHRFLRKSLDPLVRNISWQPLRQESDDERLQRLALLSLAANAGEDSRLIAEAKRLAVAWMDDRHAVPPDEANSVLSIAGAYADSALFDKFLAEIRTAKEPSDRDRLVSALGFCRDGALAQQALNALAAREFQPVDSMTLLFVLSSHIETRSLTYDYLKQHYDAVVAALPGDSLFSYLPHLAAGFDTPDRQSDMEAFFKDKDVRLSGGPRIIAQVSESIHLNHAFKEAQQPSLIEFLKTQ